MGKSSAVLLAVLISVCACQAQLIVPPKSACDTLRDPAAFPFHSGKGTTELPYIICTADELSSIADDSRYLGASFVLGNDIDLGSLGFSFAPIGRFNGPGATGNAFTGTFDGSGYTISNLSQAPDVGEAAALFAYTNGASISNIKLNQVKVSGDQYIAALIGKAVNTDIQNISIQDALIQATGNGQYQAGLAAHYSCASKSCRIQQIDIAVSIAANDCVGALAGRMEVDSGANLVLNAMKLAPHIYRAPSTGNSIGGAVGIAIYNDSTVTMSSIAVAGDVVTDGAFSGGAFGTIGPTNTVLTMSDLRFDGTFHTSGNNMFGGQRDGGLIGLITPNGGSFTLTNSHTTGQFIHDIGLNNTGGLIGNLAPSGNAVTVIDRCSSEMDILSQINSAYIGGGLIGAYETANTATGRVTNSYYRGRMNWTGGNTSGGFIGYLPGDVAIDHCYSDADMTAITTPSGVGGFIGVIAAPSSVSQSVWNSQTIGAGLPAVDTNNSASVSLTGVSTSALSSGASYPGWDFTTIWSLMPSRPPLLR